jgi:trimethylamine--corrinoid protein Co-methyltransferase
MTEHTFDRLPALTRAEMMQIHEASMNILGRVGVAFNSDEALEIFKTNGFKVDGKTVFMAAKDVRQALASVPAEFLLSARNPQKNVPVDANSLIAAPGYGAPYVITTAGERRKGTLQDYQNFCKLIHTSDHIDVTGYLMAEPSDRPPERAYLDMMLANILLCDKPFMCSTVSKQAAADSLAMAAIVLGGHQIIQ